MDALSLAGLNYLVLPIILLEAAFHALGVLEVWFILTRITAEGAGVMNAFLLETVSRLITIVFKLVPFLIGVDEAGAQYIAETAAIGAGVGAGFSATGSTGVAATSAGLSLISTVTPLVSAACAIMSSIEV